MYLQKIILKKVPNLPPLSNNKPIDRRIIPDFELVSCPWNWYTWKRPSIFSEVPISPGSRKRWYNLCDLWHDLRKLGKSEQKVEEIIRTEKYSNTEQWKKELKNIKDRQAFVFNETKRLAEEQRKYESLYNKVLEQRFTQDEILGFYQIRKDEIVNRIWPGQETVIVPAEEIDITTPLDVNNETPGMT